MHAGCVCACVRVHAYTQIVCVLKCVRACVRACVQSPEGNVLMSNACVHADCGGHAWAGAYDEAAAGGCGLWQNCSCYAGTTGRCRLRLAGCPHGTHRGIAVHDSAGRVWQQTGGGERGCDMAPTDVWLSMIRSKGFRAISKRVFP